MSTNLNFTGEHANYSMQRASHVRSVAVPAAPRRRRSRLADVLGIAVRAFGALGDAWRFATLAQRRTGTDFDGRPRKVLGRGLVEKLYRATFGTD